MIFKLESAKIFDSMVDKIYNDATSVLMRAQIPVAAPNEENGSAAPELREAEPERPAPRQQYTETKVDIDEAREAAQRNAASRDTREVQRTPIVNEGPKIGRNDPCPCGSGKKYKNCHGKNL